MTPSHQKIAQTISRAGQTILFCSIIASINWLQIDICKNNSDAPVPTIILIESSVLSMLTLPLTSLCALVSKTVLKHLYRDYFSDTDTHGQIAYAAITTTYLMLPIHLFAMIIAPHQSITNFLTSQTILATNFILTSFSGLSLLVYGYLLSLSRPIKLSPGLQIPETHISPKDSTSFPFPGGVYAPPMTALPSLPHRRREEKTAIRLPA